MRPTGADSSMSVALGGGGAGAARTGEVTARVERLRRLFERVSVADPPTRGGILDSARRSDPDLFPEIEELVGFHDRATGALDRPIGDAIHRLVDAAAVSITGALAEAAPGAIGPYRILHELGQGGMGVVYEAEQDFPRRRVALKVIRPEFVNAELLRRFNHEAEMLAMLDHPGIARLYQAGFGDQAKRRPYMAMELVEGRPLRELAKSGRLDATAALRLVLEVCDAVEHAHRRGVIHRDLKPSNILVGSGGHPKVLDFGVARLTAQDAPGGAGTIATSAGQIIGTLGYMSPEQLLGDSRMIDTRADVYSLGVVLFELLTGELPIEVKTMNVAQAAIAVRDQEPRRLSALVPAMRGDLDAIVAKALEKEPSRRYASAAALAQDIRNYLESRPVSARPPSAVYHAAKFARRNKGLVIAGSLAMLALAGGVAATLWQAARATRQSTLAKQESVRATQVADLLRGLFLSVTPELSRGKDSTMREFFEASVKRVDADLASEKTSKVAAAEAFVLIANAYTSVSDTPKGELYAGRAYQLFLETVGLPDDRTHGARNIELLNRANTRRDPSGTVEMAQAAYDEAVRHLGPDNVRSLEALNVLASAQSLLTNGQPRSIELWRELVARSERAFGTDSIEAIHYRHNLARQMAISTDLQETRESVGMLERVIADRTRRQGADHPRTLSALSNLGRALLRLDRPREAIDRLEPHLSVALKVLGPSHDTMVAFDTAMAEAYEDVQRFDQAVAHRRRIYEARLMRFAPESDQVISTRSYLCSAMLRAGMCDDAAPLIQTQFDVCVKSRGETDHMTIVTRNLQFQLAACRKDVPAMRAKFEELKGTNYEPKALKLLQDVEAELAAKGP